MKKVIVKRGNRPISIDRKKLQRVVAEVYAENEGKEIPKRFEPIIITNKVSKPRKTGHK